jgi:ankyrin repeat protein
MVAAASEAADLEIVRALIDHGADTNLLSKNPEEQGKSVVCLALGVGDPAIVGLLIERGADVLYQRDGGYDALIDAVHGRALQSDKQLIELLKLLIDHHVKLNSVTSYHESGTRVLSRMGRFGAVKCLLDAGADDSLLKLSPLMRAVAFGTAADVQRELERNPPLEEIDYWGRTAWLFAVQSGDIYKAILVKAAGANINACGRCGMPSLFYAIHNHHAPMLRWLLDTGMPVNGTDQFGTTCLMTAAEYGNIEAMAELIRAGADVNEKTRFNFDYAQVPEFTNLVEGFDPNMFEDTASVRTALGHTQTADVARRLLEAGADPQDLDYEARRGLLGLDPEPDESLLNVTPEEYKRGKPPRFGLTNPHLLQEPFCESMVRAGLNAYGARVKFGEEEYKNGSPVWCARRFGQSITFLPNGDIVQIAGEHEDSYDPDFYIYNDVFVHRPDGTIRIYNYPEKAFPPTDFHTATLIENDIIIIGNLGYPEARRYGVTPVYRLNTETFKISELHTTGTAPGWIYKHRAVLRSPQQIHVSGGSILRQIEGKEEHVANDQVFVFDIKLFRWSIVSSREWEGLAGHAEPLVRTERVHEGQGDNLDI